MSPSESTSHPDEQAPAKHWADALFGNLPSDSKYANLLALAGSLLMGNPEAAHHYYKVARQAGAKDADLQNVTVLTAQLSETDLSPLAIETVWHAPRE